MSNLIRDKKITDLPVELFELKDLANHWTKMALLYIEDFIGPLSYYFAIPPEASRGTKPLVNDIALTIQLYLLHMVIFL